MFEKKASEYVDHIKSMFIDYGKPQEINADGEFNIPAFNQFLARNNVTARYNEGRQDLATIDAAMHNFKKLPKNRCKKGALMIGKRCCRKLHVPTTDLHTKL